ncbi:aromatic acid exporter family protein [Virgibacillus sp. NKC19-3]|uniref:aromatic acid exporter family protein n=1 Tax=Virgibacillus saliphilus TaxID=2831674 RepID=UPI001C9B2380|nr:aromatic acid exporter family protein [Virgibacillus sp. NKC19-3]MBY7143425.1 aromatic acid exporter family protein [Virgibacillus sp. NKC19-3]
MKIGYRTIKTAIGVPIAISIAQFLGLTNFVSAGILTILCIQPSRKKSFLTAWHRFFACILSILFSFIFFETIGYNAIALALMLTAFIPTTVYLKITPGIGTSSVITLNLYSFSSMSSTFIIEQLFIIIIGIGIALLLNVYMPSLDVDLKKKQNKLEANFKIILYEIALYIRNKNVVWDGKEIAETEEILQEAEDLVERDKENHLLRGNHIYHDYFEMRMRQFELLQRMLPLVTKLPNKDSISEKIANFFENLSESVHPENTAGLFLDDLEALRREFDQEDLPQTQEEFETRANLFRLLHDIEDYLNLKRKYKKSDIKRKSSGE